MKNRNKWKVAAMRMGALRPTNDAERHNARPLNSSCPWRSRTRWAGKSRHEQAEQTTFSHSAAVVLVFAFVSQGPVPRRCARLWRPRGDTEWSEQREGPGPLLLGGGGRDVGLLRLGFAFTKCRTCGAAGVAGRSRDGSVSVCVCVWMLVVVSVSAWLFWAVSSCAARVKACNRSAHTVAAHREEEREEAMGAS